MKIKFTFPLLFVAFFLSAQNLPIVSFDLETGIVDTLPVPNFDKLVESSDTPFFVGQFNQNFAQLPEDLNDFPTGTVFTPRKRAAIDFDVSDFPLRTNVKIILTLSDGSKVELTGSMVSKKHVLISSFFFFDDRTYELITDKILVCPAYDKGEENPSFECSTVTKIYRFEEWTRTGTDFGLLELEQNIGNETGWIGIGFNNDDDFFRNNIFHKFTYPYAGNLNPVPSFFNGDTLYHFFGNMNQINPSRFYANNSFNATNGEGGSAIIKIKNRESYTAYGVQNYIASLAHSRFRNWSFFGLKDIIKNDITSSTRENLELGGLTIFPNPVKDIVNLKNLPGKNIENISVFDYSGRKVLNFLGDNIDSTIDLSSLIDGMYMLNVQFKNSNKVFKVVKMKQ